MRSDAVPSARSRQDFAPDASDAPLHVPVGLVGVVAVLVALAGTLLWTNLLMGPYRLASGLLDAVHHLEQAEAKLSDGKFVRARYETLAAMGAARRARAGLQAMGPLLDLSGPVRAADAAAREIPHLVKAAEHSAAAARGTLDIAEGALRGSARIIERDPDDTSGGTRIRLDRIEDTAAIVDRVRTQVQNARRELEAIHVGNLPRRVRPQVTKAIRRAVDADSALADAEAGFDILPSILGANETRTYLLGMQNPAELRGTGGAFLRYAELTLTDGRAELHKPRSVYRDVDLNRKRLSIPLPDDAWYVTGIRDAQRFGNANWSPDWPLSSQLIIRYGEKAAALNQTTWPRRVDGLIAVDPIVMQELLKGVGRYQIKGGRPITSKKVLNLLLYKSYAQFPSIGVRRAILNQIVDSFYARLLNPERPSELVRNFGDVLARKHMQIWLADLSEQKFITTMNWDGAIEPAVGSDYFYVVQQNVGGNKLNQFEDQTHTLDIELSDDAADVSAAIRIFNGALQPLPRYILGDSNGFHRPMVNLYVPGDAARQSARVPKACLQLQGSKPCRIDTPPPAVWPGGKPVEHKERGKKVWSATLEIPPRQAASVRFDYRVPGVVRTVGGRKIYRLVIQHQPKVRPETVVINLELPPEATEVRAPGWTRRRDRLEWRSKLQKDVVLEVSWRE